ITNAQTINMATMLVNPLSYARGGGGGGRYGAKGGIHGNFQDIDNKDADRAGAADDIPHMLNFVGSYELPFGKGRAFLNQGGVVNALLGGWHLTGNFNAASGIPLGVDCPGNEITGRCNLVGPVSVGKGDKQQRTAQWINPSAFVPPYGTDQGFWANYDPTDDRAW